MHRSLQNDVVSFSFKWCLVFENVETNFKCNSKIIILVLLPKTALINFNFNTKNLFKYSPLVQQPEKQSKKTRKIQDTLSASLPRCMLGWQVTCACFLHGLDYDSI